MEDAHIGDRIGVRPDSWEASFFEQRGEIAGFTNKLAKQKLRARSQKKERKTGGCRNRGAAARAACGAAARAARKFPRWRRERS